MLIINWMLVLLCCCFWRCRCDCGAKIHFRKLFRPKIFTLANYLKICHSIIRTSPYFFSHLNANLAILCQLRSRIATTENFCTIVNWIRATIVITCKTYHIHLNGWTFVRLLCRKCYCCRWWRSWRSSAQYPVVLAHLPIGSLQLLYQ